MTIIDAGPLFALLYKDDAWHEACVKAFLTTKPPFMTTWPAFTEAMYLVGKYAGPAGQGLLWDMLHKGKLKVVDVTPFMLRRMPELMDAYKPRMDLADASLVALAEQEAQSLVFTVDRKDFETYRLPRKKHFNIIPDRR